MSEQTAPVDEHLDMEFLRDPYVTYRRLLEERPVTPVVFNGVRMWFVTRYADVRAALADPRVRTDPMRIAELVPRHMQMPPGMAGAEGELPPEMAGAEGELSPEMMAGMEGAPEGGVPGEMPEPSPGEKMLVGHMLTMDPPDHDRLRKLVGQAFTMRRVEALRPSVEAIVDRLFGSFTGRDQVELLSEFAFPLSVTVISDLLGVPVEERDTFRAAADAMIIHPDPEKFRESADVLASYVVDLLARKRTNPDDALISALIEARDSADRLSEDELVSMVFQLLVAGYETSAAVLCTGILHLLDHPEQFAKLRADRSLLPGTIEEILRFDNSLHVSTLRYTADEVEFSGVRIPKDEFLVAALGAANHDPRRYPEPDRFDITRDASGHVSFGHGIHHCLGAQLTRLEIGVALGRLMDRFSVVEFAVPREELQYQINMTRGLERLPVRLA